jgi:hypothetical protein
MVTMPPCPSVVAAHITGLVVVLQALPAEKPVGELAATTAASRAELETAISA